MFGFFKTEKFFECGMSESLFLGLMQRAMPDLHHAEDFSIVGHDPCGTYNPDQFMAILETLLPGWEVWPVEVSLQERIWVNPTHKAVAGHNTKEGFSLTVILNKGGWEKHIEVMEHHYPPATIETPEGKRSIPRYKVEPKK